MKWALAKPKYGVAAPDGVRPVVGWVEDKTWGRFGTRREAKRAYVVCAEPGLVGRSDVHIRRQFHIWSMRRRTVKLLRVREPRTVVISFEPLPSIAEPKAAPLPSPPQSAKALDRRALDLPHHLAPLERNEVAVRQDSRACWPASVTVEGEMTNNEFMRRVAQQFECCFDRNDLGAPVPRPFSEYRKRSAKG